MMLGSQRALFDIPAEVTYLNNGSYTPLPRIVRQAGEQGVATKSTPWLMDSAAIEAQATRTRALAASFIGASADDIAIINAAAYGVATAAANLPVGGRILVAAGEFPSQSLEWARRAAMTGAMLDVVPRPADHDWTAALLERIHAPGLPPVSLAALTPLEWTCGALVDLDAVTTALRDQGAAIVIDATQAVGVLPIDVAVLRPDYLVFPTYKWLLGPYTLAFLYVAPWRQDGTPLEQHGANRRGGWDAFTGALGDPVPTARRFDMGEHHNPVSLPMAETGMTLLRGWGTARLRDRARWLTDQLAVIAGDHGFTTVPPHLRAPHLLGLRPPPGRTSADVTAHLARHGVYAADRAGWVRIGTHAFNDELDILRFAAALHAA